MASTAVYNHSYPNRHSLVSLHRPNIHSSSPAFSSSPSTMPSRSSEVVPMRIFLVQTARGLFSSSGGYKANLCLLRYLASRGHSVRQLCYSHQDDIEMYTRKIARSGGRVPHMRSRLLHLQSENCSPSTDVSAKEFVMDDGVEVVALDSEAFDAAFGGKNKVHNEIARETADYIELRKTSARLLSFVRFFQKEIIRFSPTHLISNDGLSMQASSALELPCLSMCRIAVVHTAEQLPFGPFSGGLPGHATSPRESDLLRQLDGIWTVSNAVKQYAIEHGQLQTTFFVHHPWTYLGEKKHKMPAHLHNWDKKFVGMINPCPVKGLQILLNLAKACPQFDFVVYKSWGFDDAIGKQMNDLSNITVRATVTDMEEAWHNIKVLLVPSLWFEAWGMVLTEAHLRGIPVISSDVGGLPEAMLGLDYSIPVHPIDGNCDEKGDYIVPEQDIEPWIKSLNKLMDNEREYEKLSTKVRATTELWLRGLDETAIEKWLMCFLAGK